MQDAVNKNTALLVTSIASFMTPFNLSSVTIALPSIGKDFSMNAVMLGWIVTAFTLGAASCLIPFGRLADLYGRKKIFTYGILISAVSSLLCAISTSGTMLIACRALQGFGCSMIFGNNVAMITSVFPDKERGKALGILMGAIFLGTSAGPTLGGVMVEQIGWRSIFYVNVALGLIALAAIFWRLKGEWTGVRGEKFDFTGSAIYCLSYVGIIYGITRLPEISGVWLIIAGVLGLLVFAKVELKVKYPILDVNVFRSNLVFVFGNLAALINFCAAGAVGFLLSLYLQYIKGYDTQEAGFVLVAQSVVMVIFSPITGRLSDKLEPRIIAVVGMALTAIALIPLIFLDAETSLTFIISSLVVLGIGTTLFLTPNTVVVLNSVDRRFYGVASGTLGTMRLSGGVLAIGITMVLFNVIIGNVEITPEQHQLFLRSARVAFIIFTALCTVGIFVQMIKGKVR